MSGPHSAQVMLRDPLVDCAVLETARGGILRSGLGYKHRRRRGLLNVQPDHLGSAEHPRASTSSPRSSRSWPRPCARAATTVLNADDADCVNMARVLPRARRLLLLAPTNPVVLEHVDDGTSRWSASTATSRCSTSDL